MPGETLVTTAKAAEAIGVHRATLAAWWKTGKVKPQWVTPGGQARWSIEKLREQLMPEEEEEPEPENANNG